MKKIGVIISGCGVFDGAEIQETVATLAALDNHNLEAVCLAPDIDQMHVVNHFTQEVAEDEKRNVLVESARIARGNISALTASSCDNLDGVIIPGGFGAAKNLSNYAVVGDQMEVNSILSEVLIKVNGAGKPIAALCISPIVLAKVFSSISPLLTLGADGADAENLEKLGGEHQVTKHEEVIVDAQNRLISGPCYMLDATIGNIMRGVDAVVAELKKLL